MKSALRLFALGVVLILPFAAPASAQYMYIDTNGDALHTSADMMNPNGTATTVDVWLRTNVNRDGTTATCNSGTEELTINSYAINLLATGGTVSYTNFINQQASFTIVGRAFTTNETEMTVGYATGSPLPAGTYYLGRVTVTGATGAPSLTFQNYGTLGPDPTSFGTVCAGMEADNTYKLGTDWHDADGITSAGGANANPGISAPTTASGNEGVAITPIAVTATDADAADVLTISQTGAPAFLTLITTPGVSPVTATLSGTPTFSDAGTYTITWSVSDGVNPPVTATTALTIVNVDRAPTVTAPATVSGTVGTELTVVVTASEPDAEPILGLVALPLPDGATFTPNATNTSGTLTWTPTATQAGVYTITFTANNALVGSATTQITITGAGDTAPAITPISDVTVSEGGTLSVPISATDPDNDLITLTATLPAFGTLNPPTTGTGSVSTTISLSPGTGSSGAYIGVVTATANGVADVDSFQIIVSGAADHGPVVTAPATVTGSEGTAMNFTVSVSDPDGDAITSLSGSPLPAGATFSSFAGNTSGTFSWTPASDQAGSYSITWTASNALTGTATTLITVANVDRPPVLGPISDVTVAEGATATVNIVATDQDADLITITASLPSFAILNAPTTGTDSLTTTITIVPGATDAGTYAASVTATSAGVSDTRNFTINVTEGGVDQAPIVLSPDNVTGTTGTLVTFTVTAADPNGDAITSLTATPLPTGATFVANATNTEGTFNWTPTAGQTGAFDIAFTATNSLSGVDSTHITISGPGDQPVDLAAIANVTVAEGATFTLNVSATDPDGDFITLTSNLPPFATLNAPTTGTGSVATTITFAPASGDAGTYTASVTASANGTTDTETFTITVTGGGGGNNPPVVNAPATQTVNEGVLLTFTVTATDPDGDNVALSASGLPSGASFNDGGNNTGTFSWTPSFSQAGTYTITFTGDDGNGGTATATTTITVNDVTGGAVEALVFVSGGNKTTRLRSGKPYTCVQIEPINSSFSIEDVNLSSITMSYHGQTIEATASRVDLDGDTNHNGIREIRACFSKEQLRDLFGDLGEGENLAEVTVSGTLVTGGSFQATFEHRVIVMSAPGLKPTASPNPLNPKTQLNFTLSEPSHARVAIFDLRGRLVKTLLDENRPAGVQSVLWDGSDSRGGKVASGVYFFRIEAMGTKEVLRVTVLK